MSATLGTGGVFSLNLPTAICAKLEANSQALRNKRGDPVPNGRSCVQHGGNGAHCEWR